MKVPAGALCSSTRAELMALRPALEDITNQTPTPELEETENQDQEDQNRGSTIMCLDSQAALQTADAGPAAQSSQLGTDI